VFTKCDLAPAPALPPALAARLPTDVPVFATSARTGQGLAALGAFLADVAPATVVDAGGPLRAALGDAAAATARALQPAGGPELAAMDLRQALQALDAIAGTHSVEDLLDRIYARFCLGK
jgi:tRNA modification GTPase